MSKNKKTVSGVSERTDKMKWFFKQENGKQCISKANGRFICDGSKAEVIQPSNTKTDTLKVNPK